MNMYKCTTGNMSTVSARAPVILLFLIISSKESQEKSGSSNIFICIWTAMTCIKYMFLMVYFIPKSNGSVYVKTIPFPPIRTSLHWGGLFSDAVICWLNCKKVRKQALPTQIQLKRLNYYYYFYYYYHYLNLQPSCIYASTHLLMFFFHLFMKKYQNLGRINKSWKGTSRLWENR